MTTPQQAECLVCGKVVVVSKTRKGLWPKFGLHKTCDRANQGKFPSQCAGHITPPGLDELDKWYYKGRK